MQILNLLIASVSMCFAGAERPCLREAPDVKKLIERRFPRLTLLAKNSRFSREKRRFGFENVSRFPVVA